jgi:hypothetical protein
MIRWPMIIYDSMAHIISQFHISRVPTTLTFDFSISRVSEMMISRDMSYGSDDPNHFVTLDIMSFRMDLGHYPLHSYTRSNGC